jgi:predicted transcriptional regulator
MGVDSSLEKMMRILSNTHRRRLLVALLEHNSPETIELQIPPDAGTGEKEPERLRIQMRHNHLPRLEEAGFIRWDTETQTVSKGPRFEEIRPLLELTQKQTSGGQTDGTKRDET